MWSQVLMDSWLAITQPSFTKTSWLTDTRFIYCLTSVANGLVQRPWNVQQCCQWRSQASTRQLYNQVHTEKHSTTANVPAMLSRLSSASDNHLSISVRWYFRWKQQRQSTQSCNSHLRCHQTYQLCCTITETKDTRTSHLTACLSPRTNRMSHTRTCKSAE